MKVIESRRRRLNIRLLLILGIAAVLLWLFVGFWHHRQVSISAKQLLERGMTAREAGNHRLAVAELSRYVGFAPDDTDALRDYTDSLSKIGSTRELKQQVFALNEAILRRRPEEMAIRSTQAELALDLGRIPDAASHIETIESHEKLTPKLLYIRGRCFEINRETNKAIECYENVLAAQPDHVDATEHLANLLATQKGLQKRADKLLSDLVERTGSVDSLLLRARRHAENKQTDAALADLREAVQLAPENSVAVSAFAAAVHRRFASGEAKPGDDAIYDEAIVAIRSQIGRDPENSAMRLYAARLLWIRDENQSEAIRLLREGTELEPNDEDLLFSLCDSLISAQKPPEARRLLTRFGDSVESNQKQQLLRARLQMAENEWKDASLTLAALIASVPRDSQLLFRARMYEADCLREINNNTAATSLFERTLDQDPTSTEARMGLAETHLRSNRIVAAINEYRQLKSIPRVAAFLADLLIEAQSTDVARKQRWDEIGELVDAEKGSIPNPIERAVLRADAYFTMGKTKDGWKTLIDSLSANPDSEELQLAVDRATSLLLDYVMQNRLSQEYDPAARVAIELIVEHWSKRPDNGRLSQYFAQGLSLIPERQELLDRMALSVFMISYLADRMEAAGGKRSNELLTYADDLSKRLAKLEPTYLGQRLQFLAMNGREETVLSEVNGQTDAVVVGTAIQQAIPWFYDKRDLLDQLDSILTGRLNNGDDSAELRNALALVKSAAGDNTQAKSLWEAVLRDGTDEVSARNLAWLLAVKESDGDAAMRLLSAVDDAQKVPTSADLDLKGCLEIALGRLEDAEKALVKASSQNPHLPYLVHLSYTLGALGKDGQARFMLNKVQASGMSASRLHPLDRTILERLKATLK
ncbi:MAG: tetratricopeptide repeat protein [Planctomycetaceae bacterium]